MRCFTVLPLAFAMAVATPAAADCLKCAVKGYVEALNGHDTELALSFVAEELRFVAPDVDITLDRPAVRKMLEWDAATDSMVSYEDLQWDGNVVTGEFTERNEFYALLGISERYYRLTFRFEDRLIREIRLNPTKASSPRTSEALEPFLAWAVPRHQAVLDEIYPDGRFVFDGQAAEKWLALLREWDADTKTQTQARVLSTR